MKVVPQWKVFKNWQAILGPSKSKDWDATKRFRLLGLQCFEQDYSKLPDLLTQWDSVFERYGGDPCRINSESLRPLRLSREEAWSDWLGYLLQTSRDVGFAAELFPQLEIQNNPYHHPEVIREESTETHRADMVIHWDEGHSTHLEVKLWDESFLKTFSTASELHGKHSDSSSHCWSDYILIPRESRELWEECVGTVQGVIKIQEVFWEDVTIALRKAILRQKEDLRWCSYAHGFCGSIEQKILGFPVIPKAGKLPKQYSGIGKMMEILEQGLMK